MHHVDVQFEVSTWRSRLWVHAMRLLRPFVGTERAYRWAYNGALRLARFRLAGAKRWERCR